MRAGRADVRIEDKRTYQQLVSQIATGTHDVFTAQTVIINQGSCGTARCGTLTHAGLCGYFSASGNQRPLG